MGYSFSAKKNVTHKHKKHIFQRAVLISTAGVILLTAIAQPAISYAIEYEREIKALREKNASNAENREELQVSAETLEQRIDNLQTSIAELDRSIKTNIAKVEELKKKIKESEADIATQRTVLGKNVRQMYLESEMTTIEQLATSKTLSDYVDRDQARIAMQNKVNTALIELNVLQAAQKSQEESVAKLIEDEKAMNTRTAEEKAEVARLLSLNEAEQASYTQSIAANSSKISDLQREQAAENERFLREQAALAKAAREAEARKQAEESQRRAQQAQRSTPAPARDAAPKSKPKPAPSGVKYVNGHNYPWKNVYFPNSISDPWGMYQRQCVSYTAWKVSASGRHMPYWGGRGNAKLWDDNARAAGIPVDGNPRVGDVAVSNRGTYGHVMYVEAVHSDGTISISQYNASWDGRYSEARIYPGDLVFIHF